jgi:hypothetical protein
MQGQAARFVLADAAAADDDDDDDHDDDCVVPECRGALICRDEEDALWRQVFTARPARRREFEPSSKRRKRRPAPWPPATA